MDCYILFTRSQHGHHAHVIVTCDPHFKILDERFDQLGPLRIEPEFDYAAIGPRIDYVMSHWLAQPANAKYLEKSARPIAVFHDALETNPVVTSTVPRHIVDCIAAALYIPANPHAIQCKFFTIDPVAAAQLCR
jgi:hypothetical protein